MEIFAIKSASAQSASSAPCATAADHEHSAATTGLRLGGLEGRAFGRANQSRPFSGSKLRTVSDPTCESDAGSIGWLASPRISAPALYRSAHCLPNKLMP